MISHKHTDRSPSFVEQIDPRVKFFSLLILSLQIFVFASPTPMIAVLLVLALALASARIPFSLLLKRLTSVSIFVVLILALNTFTVNGDVLFQFMGMYATREGLSKGALLSARIILLLAAATIFVRTTPIPVMIDGIEVTLRPLRKRFGAIIQVLTVSLNFVPMLIQSAQQIKKAQIARGAEPDRNILRQLRFAISAAIPLLAMSLRSSEHLALAMESRCYDPLAERSHYSQLRIAPRDWVTASFMIVQFLFGVTTLR
jgi:energy-coupling factor transport system permease protein